jgi:hypothetical protein
MRWLALQPLASGTHVTSSVHGPAVLMSGEIVPPCHLAGLSAAGGEAGGRHWHLPAAERYGAAKAKLQAQGHVFKRARSEAGFRKVSCAPVVIPSLRIVIVGDRHGEWHRSRHSDLG